MSPDSGSMRAGLPRLVRARASRTLNIRILDAHRIGIVFRMPGVPLHGQAALHGNPFHVVTILSMNGETMVAQGDSANDGFLWERCTTARQAEVQSVHAQYRISLQLIRHDTQLATGWSRGGMPCSLSLMRILSLSYLIVGHPCCPTWQVPQQDSSIGAALPCPGFR